MMTEGKVQIKNRNRSKPAYKRCPNTQTHIMKEVGEISASQELQDFQVSGVSPQL